MDKGQESDLLKKVRHDIAGIKSSLTILEENASFKPEKEGDYRNLFRLTIEKLDRLLKQLEDG